MSGVSLRLDVDRWRRHLATVAEATPGIVPVAKGNGYGFGLPRLAEEAAAARCRHDRGRAPVGGRRWSAIGSPATS